MLPAALTYVPFGHDPAAGAEATATVVVARAATVDVVCLVAATVVGGAVDVVVACTVVDVVDVVELGATTSVGAVDTGSSEPVESDVVVELSDRSEMTATTATASAARPRPLNIRWRTLVPPRRPRHRRAHLPQLSARADLDLRTFQPLARR